MSLTQFIADYGYLAVFAASLLEGETILILAGFASHQGHLSLVPVLTAAFVGGTLGDQLFFWLGRKWGPALLRRIPGADQAAPRVAKWLERHDAPLIIGIRFMYGLRIVGPMVIGAGGVSPGRFALYNVLGAAIWAPLVGGAGYLFGDALEAVLGDVGRYEEAVLLWIVAVAGLFALLRRAHQRRPKSRPRPRCRL